MQKKNPQSRSPRFPFIPLRKAINLLKKLEVIEPDGEGRLKRPDILKALGYGSFNGAAVKTIAALRAYDLLEKRGDGIAISAVGSGLLKGGTEEEKLDLRQRAALSPLMFRRIWRQARHASQEELVEDLLERGFTEPGAMRASRIYRANSEFASLLTLELEPELPERLPGKAAKKRANRKVAKRKQARMNRNPNRAALTLPLSTGTAVIPKGITQAEFRKLMQTLKTCRDLLVVEGSCKPAEPAKG